MEEGKSSGYLGDQVRIYSTRMQRNVTPNGTLCCGLRAEDLFRPFGTNSEQLAAGMVPTGRSRMWVVRVN